MEDVTRASAFVQRFGAAIRAAHLYAPTHPLARRSAGALAASLEDMARHTPQVTLACLGDDVVIGHVRLRSSATIGGLVRHFREQQIEKITLPGGLGVEDVRGLVCVLAERSDRPVGDRLASAGLTGVGVGLIEPEPQEPDEHLGVLAARHVYQTAVGGAEEMWHTVEAGETPDPGAARAIIDALAKAVSQDRGSMLALTALKSHDAYTFTHMINVSVLTMAQARALGLPASLVREFGVAGLMHDVGKTRIPGEILTKPGALTDEERTIIERHVVDGAQILRKTPEMPALAPIVAFEHHLRQDLSGYPRDIGSRTLNLCTMLVSIADVFDALRSNRAYRRGLPSDRIRSMLDKDSGTIFEPTLLRRFITLVGMFPVGTFVRLTSGEIGVVVEEHATDPFHPRIKLTSGRSGDPVYETTIVDTSARSDRGEPLWQILEPVDADEAGISPLAALTA